MDNYLDFAVKLAESSGKIIRKNFTLGMHKDWKKDQTPLTETDTVINRLVIEEIQKTFPNHSIVAEEESSKKQSEYIWVCDPVDGTVPFSHGYPTCVFSLALVKNGSSQIGVIYDPFMDRLVKAEKGKGASLNGKPIKVSQDKVITTKSIINLDADYKIYKLKEKLIAERNCYVSNLYSSNYAGLLVSCGEFLAEVYEYTKPWDAAALKVIVEEAGGKVTDIDGKDQRYDQEPINGFVASNGFIHDELLRFIKDIQKEKTIEKKEAVRHGW